MRKNILVTPLVAVLAIGASGMYVSAQDTTSSVLMGTVTGPDGKPLSGVRVYLTSGALLTPRDGRTDANGKFNFRLLPPGRYMVTYSMDGFISRKVEMSLLPGVSANGDIRLRAMDVQGAAIEIVAEVSNVITPDKTDTSVQTAFTSERIEEIGGGRGIAALQNLTPGVYGTIVSNEPNASTTFSIRGGLGRGNKILQDGQVVNDALRGTYFNAGDTIEDLIESVAVIQSPLNAKLGNTDGGIISITTKRGGNTFSGSLRYNGTRGDGGSNNRNAWQTSTAYYPDARGTVSGVGRPTDDLFNRTWQYSITGPIIPNYLTFALGGNITPTRNTADPWGTLGVGPSWATGNWNSTTWNSVENRYQRTLGTFYLDNDPTSKGYGDVIRKSYWGEAKGPNAIRYGRASGGSNTFNLYLQATPNHQFTWYYSQTQNFANVAPAMLENPPDNGTENINISWNVSYKAVLGAAGVFDARFGKSSSVTETRRRGRDAIRINVYRSYITMDSRDNDAYNSWYYGTWDKIAMMDGTPGTGVAGTGGSGFVNSGIINSAWNVFATNWRAGTNFLSMGEDAWPYSSSDIVSANANYQHMLDFKGSHILDVGWNMNQVDAPGTPGGAKLLAAPVGQISDDLDKYHIGNIFESSPEGGKGRHPGGAGYYAGKYIVFDVGTTTIGQLEPHVLLRPNWEGAMLQDGLIWNPSVFNQSTGAWTPGYLHSQLNGYLSREAMPFMKERWGSDVGDMRTTTSSIYVNDMWTINENHSLMVGLRADMFSLKDSARTVHSYTKITPRLEYKFDLNGDQRHLFAASLAQFHQMAAANLFWPFIEKKYGNTSWKFWTGAALSDPTLRKSGYYLVGYDDIMNPANYTDEFQYELSGRLFGDVDKNFKPPTSTELSLWYRHTFPNGGNFRVSFNNRSWTDLYDLFPSDVFAWDNPTTAVIERNPRIKATLKNTNDYTRTYTGIEMLWDFPITRKVSFGGNYTYSRYFHNQTQIGSSQQYLEGATTTATGIDLETPWWFNEVFSRDVKDADGNTIFNFGGRNAWQPMQSQAAEFGLGYYLIVNLTQGKARSNFTLRGNYTGGSIRYDYVMINTGRYVLPPGSDGIVYNQYPGATAAQLKSSTAAYFGQYTTNDSFSNHFTYNLNMPIAKRLSWFLNINVTNFFHHQPYSSSVPGGDVGATSILTPWFVPNSATAAPTWQNPNWIYTGNGTAGQPRARNPFIDGWNAETGNVGGAGSTRYFFKQTSNVRAITMSTGIRF